MSKSIHSYGELLPGYTLKRITRLQGGQEVEAYSIFDNDDLNGVPVYTFGTKPITYQTYLEQEAKKIVPPCATGWHYITSLESKRFVFRPAVGYKIYLAIIESDWNIDEIYEEKRYNDIRHIDYLFERAGKLIEKDQ